MAPYDFKRGQTIKTDAAGVVADRAFLAHLKIAAAVAVAADADGIHAAVASTGAQQVITSITRRLTTIYARPGSQLS